MTPFLTWLRELVTEHPGLKLLSLGLAVVIHVVVQRDSVRETEVALPVVVTNLPRGMVFTGNLPADVRVRVRGRWAGIRELLADRSLRLLVDLGMFKDGERFVFEQRSVEQQLPTRAVEVLSVEPTSFDVRLEPLEERDVPVEVSVAGEPAPGFRVTPRSLTVQPEKVRIAGPATAVRKVNTVRAAPVELGGTEQDLTVSARLLPPANRFVKLGAEEVTVQVRLEELEVARTLRNQPVHLKGCPAEARCMLDPPAADVRVEGMVRAVHALLAQPPDGLVVADLGPPLGKGERTVKLQVRQIPHLTLTPVPAVAKFGVLGEIPPPRGGDAR